MTAIRVFSWPCCWGRALFIVRLALVAVLCVLGAGQGLAQEWALNFSNGTDMGPTGETYGTSIAVDAAGNTYRAGYFTGSALQLEAIPLQTGGHATLYRIGPRDAYLAKFDSAGNLVWAKNFGEPGVYTAISGVEVDDSGHVYVSGTFAGGDLATLTLAKIGSGDAFIVKLDDSSGNTIWAKSFGGPGTSTSLSDIALDEGGHVYLSGRYSGGDLTSLALAKIGAMDAFVVKLDSTGDVAWAKNFGGPNISTEAFGIAVDGIGHVFLSGRFGSYRESGNLTLPALVRLGTIDAFVIELDSAGDFYWAKNFGGRDEFAYGMSVAVDGNGNVYLGGRAWGPGLATPALPRVAADEAFIVKLDSARNIEWAKNFGGLSILLTPVRVAVDGGGNVYLGGTGGGAFTTPALDSLGTMDAFVLKLDSSGTLAWAQNFGGKSVETSLSGLAVDGSGHVYWSGDVMYYYGGDLSRPALEKISLHDGLAVKLDSAGNIVQAANFGGLDTSAKAAILSTAADASGNVYVAGRFSGTTLQMGGLVLNNTVRESLFLAKFDDAGNVVWAKDFAAGCSGVVGHVEDPALAVDGSGNVYLAGYFGRSDHVTRTLSPIGPCDAFVLKLEGTGNLVWARRFGGQVSLTYGSSVEVDQGGNVYLGGYFRGASLDSPALTKIGEPGNYDAFVVKLDSNGSTLWAKNFGGKGLNTRGYGVGVDRGGNVYLGGTYGAGDDELGWGDDYGYGDLTTPALKRLGYRDAFVVKLDSTGEIAWAKNFGGPVHIWIEGRSLAVDDSGGVYLGGAFFGNSSVAGVNGDLATPALSRFGNVDAFTLKLDGDGNLAWARNFGGAGARASVTSLALDGSGGVYLGGYVLDASLATPALARFGTRDAFALRLDGAGNVDWAENFGGLGAQAAINSLVVDGRGHVYLGGSFSGANLAMPTLTKIGGEDALLIKMTDPSIVVAPQAGVDYGVVYKHSGKCQDVAWASLDAGAEVIQWPCHGGDNQQLRLVDKGNGYYSLVYRHSGLCTDVYGAGMQAGEKVIQWPCHGGDNQLFTLEEQGGGYYAFRYKHSGQCIDVYGAGTTDGARVIQWPCHGGDNQLFQFVP